MNTTPANLTSGTASRLFASWPFQACSLTVRTSSIAIQLAYVPRERTRTGSSVELMTTATGVEV